MEKTLEIGKDYSFAVGAREGCTFIYRGGDRWEATNAAGQTQTLTSTKATAAVLSYINRPTVRVGNGL